MDIVTHNDIKIFQIGFNKCGTYSFYKLFHNYTKQKLICAHWQGGELALTIKHNVKNNIKPILGKYSKYNYMGDMEHATYNQIILAYKDYFIDLDQNYPNSKFILNIRPIDDWINSRLNHEKHLKTPYVLKYKKNYNLNSDKEVVDLWKQQWHEHINKVLKYFEDKNNLLVYNLKTDNINKIVAFFSEITFTTNQFPRYNVTT